METNFLNIYQLVKLCWKFNFKNKIFLMKIKPKNVRGECITEKKIYKKQYPSNYSKICPMTKLTNNIYTKKKKKSL